MSSILKALQKKTQSRRPRVEEGFYRPAEGLETGNARRPTIVLGVVVVILLLVLCALVGMRYIEGVRRGATIPTDEVKASAYVPPATPTATPTVRDERDQKIETIAAELTEMKTLLREFKETTDSARNTQPITIVMPGAQSGVRPDGAPVATLPETVPGATQAAPPTPTPSPPRKPDFPLNGTMSAGGKNTAFISGSFYEVGDTVDGWKIVEVGKGYIMVEGWPERIWIQN